jgi:hypothetical protein
MYASPDSSTVNLQAFLLSLHSRLLSGQNFSNLKYTNFGCENTGGMDYQSYSAYVHDADMIKKKRVSSAISLSKSF